MPIPHTAVVQASYRETIEIYEQPQEMKAIVEMKYITKDGNLDVLDAEAQHRCLIQNNWTYCNQHQIYNSTLLNL